MRHNATVFIILWLLLLICAGCFNRRGLTIKTPSTLHQTWIGHQNSVITDVNSNVTTTLELYMDLFCCGCRYAQNHYWSRKSCINDWPGEIWRWLDVYHGWGGWGRGLPKKDGTSEDISPPAPTSARQVYVWEKASIDEAWGLSTLPHNPNPIDDTDADPEWVESDIFMLLACWSCGSNHHLVR